MRYFIEVAYVGTNYSGFQVQQNANTIQAEVERALKTFYKQDFSLTGSSRTDAGVHALQNFFHVDCDADIAPDSLYNLNSLLGKEIVIKSIFRVNANAHCRFDAVSRTYNYYISRNKNPFLYQRAYYYPYKINSGLLHSYAEEIKHFANFTSFSKRNTQVKGFNCSIIQSAWKFKEDVWMYETTADRFLRGMIKALVGTMLKLARNNEPVSTLQEIIASQDCTNADFSAPSHGLFLKQVQFKAGILL